MVPPPLIDKRTAEEIAQQIKDLLKVHVPGWNQNDQISLALIQSLARFAEIIIQRLNQVPEKNFLAFLDLLGACRQPPQAARVPLTFSLTAKAIADAVVPAGTQVAATPAPGESDPTIFETERELFVSAVQIGAVYGRNPQQDTYSDRSAVVQTTSAGVPIWSGDRPVDHLLYIGQRQLSWGHIQRLSLTVEVEQPLSSSSTDSPAVWELWDGTATPLSPTSDSSQSFTVTGRQTIKFGAVAALPLSTVNGIESRWLRCRLNRPMPPGTIANQLKLKNLSLKAEVNRSGLAIATAFTNRAAVDLSKDFFPFGERPQFGDTLYLAQGEAFSVAGATLSLHVELTNPIDGKNPPVPPVKASDDLQLQFEYWDGRVWDALEELPQPDANSDQASRFTNSGLIQLKLPEDPPPKKTAINGIEDFWLRVRIGAGNYGETAHYEVFTNSRGVPYTFKKEGDRYQLQEASANNEREIVYKQVRDSYAPPLIHAVQVGYSLTKEASPDAIVTNNDFVYSDNLALQTDSFTPFQRQLNPVNPTLYLGFTLPSNRAQFPNRPLSIFCQIADISYSAALTASPNTDRSWQYFDGNMSQLLSVSSDSDRPLHRSAPVNQPDLIWEYFDGTLWRRLSVRDETEGFSHSGLIAFLPPADFAPREEFGLMPHYWIRAQLRTGPTTPKLQRLLLNTTTAIQTRTLHNEILGSSDGTAHQILAAQSPILAGQQLEVQEPVPSARQNGAVSPLRETRSPSVWVAWSEQPDFYSSQPHDRHYVINHLTGEIRFGDGQQGRIPPLGAGNIRLKRYQTGGGTAGNQPQAVVNQLTTTIAYVKRVTNLTAAAGGTSAETLEALQERVPRQLRHRDRAVTVEDYEDLAQAATPEVARAKGVPLFDLNRVYRQLANGEKVDLGDDKDNPDRQLGTLSLIVVPHPPPQSTIPNPMPSLELLHRVQRYLDRRRSPTAQLVVVGPYYIAVNVTVEIVPTALERANTVEAAVRRTLEQFLHPLTGGLEGTGWNFGRYPHRSDFYALLEAVSGVDYVRQLTVSAENLHLPSLFLVYSGTHQIHLQF